MSGERQWAAGIAAETLHALEIGHYGSDGDRVPLTEPVQRAIAGTVSYPGDPPPLAPAPDASGAPGTIEVTPETTLHATRRLAEAGHRVAALNFASGRNPGGGFLRGAIAQEETLARSSALYPCRPATRCTRTTGPPAIRCTPTRSSTRRTCRSSGTTGAGGWCGRTSAGF